MAEPRERTWTQTGEYEEMYSPEEVYQLVKQAPRGVITTPDICNVMGCTRTTATRKLRDLAIEGKIEKREPSGKITLWYPPEDADEVEEDAEATLKRLSNELGEAITVGDTVYESGSKHSVEQSADS